MENKLFKSLFNQNEYIAVGNETVYDVVNSENSPIRSYYTINPIDPYWDYKEDKPGARRADLNVTKFRNFLFEMDFYSLEEQLKIIAVLDPQPTAIVYSGGKSHHCLYSFQSDIDIEPHKPESLAIYKGYWIGLQERFDKQILDAGYKLPSNKTSFFDNSCKNPSRYSRMPGFIRNGVEQKLLNVGAKIDNSILKLAKVPILASKKQYNVLDVEQFKLFLPVSLKRMLDTPSAWGGTEGVYPTLYSLLLWAFDSTGAPTEIIIDYMEQKTFPKLLQLGYSREKIDKAVEDAVRRRERS